MTHTLKERVIQVVQGERIKVQFVLEDGTVAEQYALIEHRPPGYRTGDGRAGVPRLRPCGAVAMKHPGGNGSYHSLDLTAERHWLPRVPESPMY